MLGTELPPDHGVVKKRNKIIARVRGPVTCTETGSQQGGGCSKNQPYPGVWEGPCGVFCTLECLHAAEETRRQKEETLVWDTEDAQMG